MAAPQIPNLNHLRSARQSPFGRGGRGRPRAGLDDPDHVDDTQAKDKIVQRTDQDASVSRMSAIEIGYLDDPYARDLVVDETLKRFPIINRGTFVRTTALDILVAKFLNVESTCKKQIISLGAGSDTRFFRLRRAFPDSSLLYHELDFPTITARKISAISRSQSLTDVIQRSQKGNGGIEMADDSAALYSSTYNIHPVDLRSLVIPDDQPQSRPLLPNVDAHCPTLLLSECCLIYLPPNDADAILKSFVSSVLSPTTALGLIIYEPINPNDSFGRVMVQNLANRGIVLQTLKKYASLGRQKARLKAMGFYDGQKSADVDFIWENWIVEDEKERVARLEMLDEVEEWRMLAQHYCVAWGWRDGEDGDGSESFRLWREDTVAQQSDD